MRRTALTVATAGFAALALTGCEQPPPGSAPQQGTPQFAPLELDLPQPDAPVGADPDDYGPLLPATPDGPGQAPDPVLPDEVTAYCHGGAIVDYKPKTPDAHARAQGICADQDTYDQHGTGPDADPFANPDEFQRDMQRWLDQQ